MRIACCVSKAADAHSECITLNAFPRQQWLGERAPILPYMSIACSAPCTALDGHVGKLPLISSPLVQLRFEEQNRKLLTIQIASANFWWEIGVETFRCELMDVAIPQCSG
jgi:hypothetical protein